MGTGAKVEKKVGVISGLGLKWGLLLFAGSLLNVLTLTPNPGNTIRAWRLASNCNGGFQPATGRMEKGEQEFLGARLLCQSLVRDYCASGSATRAARDISRVNTS